MRKILLFLWAIMLSAAVYSQSATNLIAFPRMTPPSPDAASLGRYGEFPVTLATGTPEISIPLYEINTGKLKLPIGLSYHASGIRVNDIASRVGLGWSLQAGGAISRVIRGLPDDYGYFINGVPSMTDPTTALLCFEQNSMFVGNEDGEPDIFYYNTPQKSGKFVFTNTAQTGVAAVPVTIPYDLIKIKYYGGQFTVTDVDGTLYVYGTSMAGKSALETTTGTNSSGSIYHGVSSFTSSWYLTDIISADKSDSIKLIYADAAYVAGETHVAVSMNDDINEPNGSIPHVITYSYDVSHTDVQQTRLKEIDFRNGKVSFDYNPTQRADRLGDSSLIGLRVYQNVNGAYNQIKRYILYQSYFNCNNLAPQSAYGNTYTTPSTRLRLDSLKQADNTGVVLPGYSFGYVSKLIPNLGSCAQDFWGFYNAANNANLLIYNEPHSGNNSTAPSTAYGANRNVNSDSVDAGTLNKITFPTGGYTTFQFESNMLGSTKVGGIRIKKIVSYDGLGGGVVKTYNYLNPTSISNLYNGDMAGLGQFFMRPYQSVEHYSSTDPSNVTRSYATYFENFSVPLGSSSGSAVSYSQVEELFDSTNGTNGKNVYYFDVTQDASPSIIPQNTVTNEWIRGTKIGEKKYKTSSPGNFVLLESKNYIYNLTSRSGFQIYSFASRPLRIDQYCCDLIVGTSGCTSFSVNNTYTNVYNPITIGNNYLTSEIDTVFDQNGQNPQIDTTNYFYDDSANVVPLRIERKNSKGIVMKTVIRTPLEKSSINSAMTLTTPASLAIDSMLAKNIVGPTIDQDKYYGSYLAQRIRTNYKVFTSNLVAPSDIQAQIGGAPVETRVQFNSYDNFGNVISGSKTGDARTTYIWDYQKAFVIAEVRNADSAFVAYTSFEADGTGGWTLTDTTCNRVYCMTGSQCYNLVTGKSISKTVPSGKQFIVSYWSRNGAITVTANGTGVAATLVGLAKNGWTYYEHVLPNTTTSVSLTATNAVIDELRLYPQGAQMTTYTYSPLVGLSSTCSVNNTVLYYEYDSFNRLRAIKDMDKNVIKAIDYEYQASPHTFYSIAKSGAFTRNNCTSCLMGTTVTYPVPAGKYTSVINQADADQKAQNDVDNNGQAYANDPANGSCVTPTTAPITGANGTTKSFTLAFHNNCTGANYNFTLNVTTGTSIGPVPVGNYNITISPVGGTGTYTYMVNGFVQNTTNASFFSIDITSSSNTITIH